MVQLGGLYELEFQKHISELLIVQQNLRFESFENSILYFGITGITNDTNHSICLHIIEIRTQYFVYAVMSNSCSCSYAEHICVFSDRFTLQRRNSLTQTKVIDRLNVSISNETKVWLCRYCFFFSFHKYLRQLFSTFIEFDVSNIHENVIQRWFSVHFGIH